MQNVIGGRLWVLNGGALLKQAVAYLLLNMTGLILQKKNKLSANYHSPSRFIRNILTDCSTSAKNFIWEKDELSPTNFTRTSQLRQKKMRLANIIIDDHC